MVTQSLMTTKDLSGSLETSFCYLLQLSEPCLHAQLRTGGMKAAAQRSFQRQSRSLPKGFDSMFPPAVKKRLIMKNRDYSGEGSEVELQL